DGSRAVAEAMKAAHPDVFASLHRYETAGLDAALVEASEEISAGLTVLKPLWPQLLPLYASPLELYERWTRWIGEFNARERPTSPTPLQGTPSDLLRFLEHELERLGVAGSELAATVRYERLKHDAVRSLAAAGPLPDGRAALTPDAILRPRCEFMLEPVDGRWMVLAKPRGDNVNILRVDEGAWRILSAVERAPLPVFALATLAARDADGLDIVERLVEHGLLEVAA
ncbi:MAG TPA: hypothetical protein VFZ00_21045, partial [Solirubrobacter sp.]|nr:hypothetical protein [Solirubrobacter sp.]